MLTFPAPVPLDGELLLSELTAVGVAVTSPVVLTPDGIVRIDATGDTAVIESVLAAHPQSAADAAVAEESARANAATIRDRAALALSTNADFLALVSPTNAQNAAQVKALTRQVNGLIRLVLGRLDGTE